MQEAFWSEFVQAAPGIAGVVVVVVIFVKWGLAPLMSQLNKLSDSWQAFLKEQREAAAVQATAQAEELRRMTEAQMAESRRMTEALINLTESFNRHDQFVHLAIDEMRRVSRKQRRPPAQQTAPPGG